MWRLGTELAFASDNKDSGYNNYSLTVKFSTKL